MAEASGVAHHLGIEHLTGGALGHGPGNHPATGTVPIQRDLHVAFCHLITVGHEPLGDHGLSILAADDLSLTLGGVDAPDLDGLHLDGGALFQIDNGLGVHDAATGAVAVTVVLFRVFHMGVLTYIEGVDTVMTAVLPAAVVDAAAGHDVHIAVFTDVEVIVDQFLNTGLGDDDGNVALFALGPILDADVNAGFAVGLAGDLDVLRGLPAVAAGVLANVEGAYRLADQVRDFFQQLPIYLRFHHKACTSLFSTGQPPSVSVRIRGRISFGVPRWRRVPSPTTMTSSAKEIIRS